LDLDIKFDGLLGDFETRPWKDFVSPSKLNLAKPEALDLIDRLLVYDHHDRITAKEAMDHSYFAKTRLAGGGGDGGSTLPSSPPTLNSTTTSTTAVSDVMDELKSKLKL
jgi:serine/threonine protein kinase